MLEWGFYVPKPHGGKPDSKGLPLLLFVGGGRGGQVSGCGPGVGCGELGWGRCGRWERFLPALLVEGDGIYPG